jgi:hypothetical protein
LKLGLDHYVEVVVVLDELAVVVVVVELGVVVAVGLHFVVQWKKLGLVV